MDKTPYPDTANPAHEDIEYFEAEALDEINDDEAWCWQCHRFKKKTEFYKDKSGERGVQIYCKPCFNQYMKDVKKKDIAFTNGYYTQRYSSLKSGAKKRNILFDITQKELRKWWMDTDNICHYCGSTWEEYAGLRKAVLDYTGNNWDITKFKRFFGNKVFKNSQGFTIDRRDNSMGYIIGNLVKSCWWCNCIKSSFFSEDLMKKIAPQMIQELRYGIATEMFLGNIKDENNGTPQINQTISQRS